jgi:hypothetical protein
MAAKKLDLAKAIEREHEEPKLNEGQESRPGEKMMRLRKAADSKLFEIRLKEKLIGENERLILENVKLGMTPEEVIEAAGNPDSAFEWYSGNLKYKYGSLWVVIENGAVTCIVHAKYFEKYWGKSDYQNRNPMAIYK